MLEQLRAASLAEAWLFFLAANGGIFAGSVVLCWGLGSWFPRKRLFDRWEALRPIEVIAALISVILNAGVSVGGWLLWTEDVITIGPTSLWRSAFDGLVMLLAMDLGMYVFHRLAHRPSLYRLFHGFHHRHEATNPISLFVLHPVEVVGFGALLILFLMVYPMTLGGLIGYLTLNVLFGTIGHSGVEPFPPSLRCIPVAGLVGTSTFHAEHHEHPDYNFGFYTLFWDLIFGTLDPEYDKRFKQEPHQE